MKVLLFGEAAQAHWKAPVGHVVALTNAEPATDKPLTGSSTAKTAPDTTLKIYKPLQVLLLGMAFDYGTCKV